MDLVRTIVGIPVREQERMDPDVLIRAERWQEYERRKAALRARHLPWPEYERALRAVIDELGL